LFSVVMEAGRLAHMGRRGITVWTLASGARWTWSAPDLVSGALSPDGRTAVVADARSDLYVLDADGRLQQQFRGPSQGVACIAIFPDGRRAVTCSPGGLIVVWELATGRRVAERQVGAVNEISLSRDGALMVAIESDQLAGRVSAWLLADDLSSRVIRLEHEAGLINARFSPAGDRLATLSVDGNARIWRRDGALEATLQHAGPVAVAAWSSDGSWLVTGTRSGTLTFWDRSPWRMRKAVDAHANFINALEVDDRDALIASGGGDTVLKLWDVESFLQVDRIPTGMLVGHLAFERDQILVSGPRATQAWRCDR
jgi:WD40 repeat protein